MAVKPIIAIPSDSNTTGRTESYSSRWGSVAGPLT